MAKVQSVSGGHLYERCRVVVQLLNTSTGNLVVLVTEPITELISNAHDHYAFSPELRKYVQKHPQAGGGPSGRKYQIGSTTGGKHATTSYHYVGQAFDIPWSQFGSGKIGQKDFQQSRQLDKDVRTLVAQFNGQEQHRTNRSYNQK